MNVLMIVGSPRPDGNCDVLTRCAAEGARAAGADVELVHLARLSIAPCDACNGCRRDDDGRRLRQCVKDDDMQPLYAKLRWADALLIATPVYWWGPSAQTKLFVDRWYAVDDRTEVFSGKPLALIASSGSSSPRMADPVFGPFRSIAAYLGMPLVEPLLWVTGRPVGQVAATNGGNLERARELGRQLAAKARTTR
jgi:multimeric flavodoxin WrbA